MSSRSEQRMLQMLETLQHENALLRARAGSESHSRLMAEEALGQSEDRLQLALDAAGLALWEWDVVSDTVFTSARFAQILGDAVDDQAQDIVWPTDDFLRRVQTQDLATLRAALIAVLKQTSRRLEVEFRVDTGHGIVWLECTGEVTQRDMLGRAERLVGIARNVTRRLEIQHDMEQARLDAIAANAAKDEFLAHMSHEIRTPLNGVIGMNNLLLHTQLDTEQRQYVELVGSSGRALLVLVNDVLDYSRLQAHKLVLEQVRFNLRRWLWEVVTPQRIAAQAKGLDLQLQVDESLPQEVVGDPGRLRQIVINLVSNAIKFTDKGWVKVDMRMFEGRMPLGTDAALAVQFQVVDSGIGIAEDKKESIFAAFVQADSSTSRRYGGTGLGLSICANLVDLMGGTITLDSILGQGSRFTVLVPLGWASEDTPVTQFGMTDLDSAEPPVAKALTSTLPHFVGKTALVVDDHHVNQLLAGKLLQRLGFAVDMAGDGEQALRAVQARSFDVVLLDIQMPRMNGWQATQQIRQWEQAQAKSPVPIIALSAHASAADREHALASGMNGYVSKPLTPEALLAALQATVIGAAMQAVPVMAQSATMAYTGLVNRQRILARLGGDEAALQEMAKAFCNDLRERMALVFSALKTQDWATARAQTHALTGSLLTMTAEQAAGHAKALEQAVLAGDSVAAKATFNQLSKSAKTAFDTVQAW